MNHLRLKAHAKHPPRHRRGITLLLTMLVLVLAVTVLARQMLETTVVRMSSASVTFAAESRGVAEGVARQWQERSCDPKLNIDDLLRPVSWTLGDRSTTVPVSVEITPTSTENKLSIALVPEADWVTFWQNQASPVTLAENPAAKLLVTADTALEVILAPRHITAQDAYVTRETNTRTAQTLVPFDIMTVWGEGHLDLNRASREVLQARFKTFTDAQISGILRVCATGPINDLKQLLDELSLSEDQSQLLNEVAVFAPKSLELLIRIHRGSVSALYLAVLSVGKEGQVLEVRPIL